MVGKLKHPRRKGKRFEKIVSEKLHNLLCKKFPEYKQVTEQIETLGIERDPYSGSSFLNRADIRLNYAEKYFPFHIECKMREDLNYTLKDLAKSFGELEKIYEKTKKKAENTPIIVFSFRYSDIFVFAEKSNFKPLINNLVENDKFLLLNGSYFICRLEDFVEYGARDE